MSKNLTISRFNLRVYAIIFKDNMVLLCEECLGDFQFTKFPGGGVEAGEGIMDALHRELQEELNTEIISYSHYYTTEFFQQSAFNPADQIISIYYKVVVSKWPADNFEVQFTENHKARFFYNAINESLTSLLTFPIDRHVSKMLSQHSL